MLKRALIGAALCVAMIGTAAAAEESPVVCGTDFVTFNTWDDKESRLVTVRKSSVDALFVSPERKAGVLLRKDQGGSLPFHLVEFSAIIDCLD